MTEFGASFKKARESKSISLDQIAKETRISIRFLKAIEDEQFHVLPGGVFNRGFVRTYAEQVGLDPVQAVADYERLSRTGEPSEPLVASSGSHVEGHLYPIAIGALILLIAIFYLVTRHSDGTAQTANPPAPVSQPEPSAPAPTTAAAAASEPVPAPPVEAPPVPEPVQALTIEIEVQAKTWIKLTTDGTIVLAGEVLEAGVTRKFSAESSIALSVGNAGGLTVKVNDKLLKPFGKSGQVRVITITPENLKDFIS